MVWKRREGIMSSFGPIPKLDRDEMIMDQRPTQPHSSYKLAPAYSANLTSRILTPNSENDFSKNHATPKPQKPGGVLLFVCGNPFPFPLSCQNQIN